MSWRLSVSPASTFWRQHFGSQSIPCSRHRFRYNTGWSSHTTLACSLCSAGLHLKAEHVRQHSRSRWQHVRSASCLQQFKSDLQTCRALASVTTSGAQHTPLPEKQLTMDYTALVASVQELKDKWIPAKVEQVCLSQTLLYW